MSELISACISWFSGKEILQRDTEPWIYDWRSSKHSCVYGGANFQMHKSCSGFSLWDRNSSLYMLYNCQAKKWFGKACGTIAYHVQKQVIGRCIVHTDKDNPEIICLKGGYDVPKHGTKLSCCEALYSTYSKVGIRNRWALEIPTAIQLWQAGGYWTNFFLCMPALSSPKSRNPNISRPLPLGCSWTPGCIDISSNITRPTKGEFVRLGPQNTVSLALEK